MNEHITLALSFNPTVIPDHILTNLTPVFVIRNPIFAVPSNYITYRKTSPLRVGGEDWEYHTCMSLQCRLFDFVHSRDDGKYPIVFDGDDVIWRTDEVRDKLLLASNLEPSGFSNIWDATPEDKRHKDPTVRSFLQTIDDSTGIMYPSDQRPSADLDIAYQEWFTKYAEEAAKELRATLEENMSHYL